MKPIIYLCCASAILVAGCSTAPRAQSTNNHEIATGLLELHHQWAMNGYNPPSGKDMPSIPAEHGHADAAAFTPLGGYLQYDYQTNGMTWFGRFEISRPDTNTTTWTVSESGVPANAPGDTNLLQMAWEHKLITVTGEP